MNYISTTDLRKSSSVLRDSLRKGESTYILHRSKVIGVVEPYIEEEKIASRKQLMDFISSFPVKKPISYKQREKLKRKHLEERYGKNIS